MRTRTRSTTALLAVSATLTAGGIAGLAPTGALGSSHREAPAISGLPQYDTTDVYAFVSPDKPDSVTLIANWIPFEEPAGGPNFYPFATDARYDISVDNDGDARPDVTYRWTFDTHTRNGKTFLYNTGPVTSLNDRDLNVRQTYDLKEYSHGEWHTLLDDAPVAPSNVGKASMPNYGKLFHDAVRPIEGGTGRSYAGQADDPFFLDLRVFDLLYGGDLSEVGTDTLAGYNINAVALQVPKSDLVAKDKVIGIWSTTYRKSSSGDYRRVSRLGMPLVNEVVIPLRDKDKFNASKPKDDAQFLDYVTKPELPKLLEAIYGLDAPAEPRNDLVSVFLTGVKDLNMPAGVKPSEQLRLNTGIAPTSSPKRLGVLDGDTAGFPNGRRLTDDVVDIALQVVRGELVGKANDLGDAVNKNDKAFRSTFPYLAQPYSGSVTRPAPSSGATALTGGNVPDSPTGGGLPVVPASVTALGLLGLLGAVVLRRRQRTLAAQTA